MSDVPEDPPRIPPDPPPFPPFEVAGSETVYDSPWCRLRRDEVRLADRLQEYHVFEVNPAVCVVPILPDGSILMLWQYRYPHGETHWEVPAGRIDDGEEPAAAAARELLEETGHAAARLEHVVRFYAINGISPHAAHVYLAHDCERVADTTHDASERMSVHAMSADEAWTRLLRGDFADGFTSIGLFHHFARTGWKP